MLNLDFHNLLDERKFVHFVRDVLEIRENGLKFTSYKRGRDGGIDIRCTNSAAKIIGQVKLFHPDNYRILFSNLRAEVSKCKQHQPDRYILCIGNQLNPQQATEILNLFEGYIRCEEDLVDGIKLNKYINQPEYKHLKEVYASLLVPDLTYVEHLIDKVVNRRIFNKTQELFERIGKFHNLYYNTLHYRKVLKKLNHDRMVIITGNPGVGKTTTAEMIVHRLLTKTWDHVYKLNFFDIDDLFLRDEKQLFFVDDFWGSQFKKEDFNRDYLKRFWETIEMIRRSKQHYLIMTSRSYIIQAVLNNAEKEVEEIVKLNNYTINLEAFSPKEKAKIFFNHLLFYNCNPDFFKYFAYSDRLERIIYHENYSPRHIEYFLKFKYTEEMDEDDFYRELMEYLDKPHAYWEKVFDLQSDTARLILLLIFISSDPISKENLRTTLTSVSSYVNAELNLVIQLLSFEEELRTLENLFITSEGKADEQVWFKFSSPGIKDYLLEYLRDNIVFWGKPLIQGACFFNQLYYAFDTKKEKLEDLASDVVLYGEKIVLPAELQKILKDKLIQDFDRLNFSTGSYNEVSDMICYVCESAETEYYKYIILQRLFSIEKHTDVREFIVSRVKAAIRAGNIGIKMTGTESMFRFPYVVRDLLPYLNVAPEDILTAFHESISLAIEYHYFYAFKEIFPREFGVYYAEHIQEIREDIRMLILGTSQFYKIHCLDFELDQFIDFGIKELQKEYGFRLSRNLVSDIEYFLGKSVNRMQNAHSGKVYIYRKSKRKKSCEKSLSETILSLYIGKPEVEISEPEKFIKNNCPEKELTQRLLNAINKRKSLIQGFLTTTFSVFALIEYLSACRLEWETVSEYCFLNYFVKHCFSRFKREVPVDKLTDFFINLALEHFNRGGIWEKEYYYAESRINRILEKSKIRNINLDELYPFLVKRKKWYTFLNYELFLYFIVQAIIRINHAGKYKRMIFEFSDVENRIWKFIDEADNKRFRDEVLYPEIRRFMNALKAESPRKLVLSLLKFFNPELDLVWIKKENSFEVTGESYSEYKMGEIIQLIGVDFDIADLIIFFNKEYYWAENENLKLLKMREQSYPVLYDRLLQIFGLVDDRGIPVNSTDESLSLNLYLFAQDAKNYQAMKEMGAEDYILAVYREIQLKLDEATVEECLEKKI